MSLPELDRYVAGRGSIGDLLVRLYHDNPLAAEPTVPGHSWVLWDLAPIAWLIDPSWVPTTHVDRATVGRGHQWATGEGELTEAFGLDRRGVYSAFLRRIKLSVRGIARNLGPFAAAIGCGPEPCDTESAPWAP